MTNKRKPSDPQSVDTGSMLLRLAGKPAKKGENEPKDKAKVKQNNKEKKRNNDRNGSTSSPKLDTKSEKENSNNDKSEVIPEDMDETTLSTFRDLFNMLDQSNTGIITVDNLYEELRNVDSEITFSEVEDLLRRVDKDGDGQIDFNEFLYHMTTMEGDLFGECNDEDEEKKKSYSKRKRLFNAITQFSIKQTLVDMEKTFQKQVPHVISHYTAGVRLIGLTTRQLERQMKRMQKTAAKNDSPYAKPLQFVHLGGEGKNKYVERKEIKSGEKSASHRDILDLQQVENPVDESIECLGREIQDTMKLFAKKRESDDFDPVDANIIKELRKKIGSVTAKIRGNVPDAGVGIEPPATLEIPKPHPVSSRNCMLQAHPSRTMKNQRSCNDNLDRCSQSGEPKLLSPGQGWTTPRIQYLDVPLPSLKMKPTSEKPTFNDLHRIRAKARQAIDAYYHNLRQAEIRNAWDHWDRLYADVIQPKKLLQNFRVVYSAYSPHREEEAFVVCPWKPGAFRFVSHAQKPPTYMCPPKVEPVTISSPRYSCSKSRANHKCTHSSPTLGRTSSMMRQVPYTRQIINV